MRSNFSSDMTVESLEARQLFSSASMAALEAVQSALPAVQATLLPQASVKTSTLPQVVGNWKGVCTTVGAATPSAISMQIKSQPGAGASGTFSLGPITQGGKLVSTAIVSGGNQRGFAVILEGKNYYGSVTATVDRSNSYIVGRWCVNTGKTWLTGTLTMTRVK